MTRVEPAAVRTDVSSVAGPLLLRHDPVLVRVIVVAATLRRQWYRLLREGLLLAAGWLVYALGRFLVAGRVDESYENARQVWDLERRMGLPDESVIQAVALRVPHLAELANGYYASVHFPLTIATLAWLFVWHPERYLRMRKALLWITCGALVIHLMVPLAPPRLVPWEGLVDTATQDGMSVYGPVGTGFANQFAAMPSLHFGWSVLVAAAVIATVRSRWRWLAVLHPALTLFVVLVTANHYLLDCAVAGGLAVLALRLSERDVRAAVAQAVRPRRPLVVDDRRSPDGAL